MSRTRRIAVAALAVAALTLPVTTLAACGSQGTSTSSSGMAAPEPAAAGGAAAGVAAPPGDSRAFAATAAAGAPADASAAAAAAAAPEAAKAAAVALPASLLQARLVRTAEVVVEVNQLATSAARVRAAAVGLGGLVSSEVTTYAPTGLGGVGTSSSGTPQDLSSAGSDTAGGSSGQVKPGTPGESVIVVRVPVNSLDAALDKVSAIGKELARSSSSQDVTADLADLGSRVKTQQASVDRIRVLLARATSMQDIVLLEGQLTTREADLEALQARQASLADRADLSTLTVTLRTPEAKVADPVEDNGFVAGLKSGWRAVLASTTLVLTVLGALLPLLIAGALIGVPAYLLIRRRARARAAARAAAAPVGVPVGVPVSVLMGGPGAAGTGANGPAAGTGANGPTGQP